MGVPERGTSLGRDVLHEALVAAVGLLRTLGFEQLRQRRFGQFAQPLGQAAQGAQAQRVAGGEGVSAELLVQPTLRRAQKGPQRLGKRQAGQDLVDRCIRGERAAGRGQRLGQQRELRRQRGIRVRRHVPKQRADAGFVQPVEGQPACQALRVAFGGQRQPGLVALVGLGLAARHRHEGPGKPLVERAGAGPERTQREFRPVHLAAPAGRRRRVGPPSGGRSGLDASSARRGCRPRPPGLRPSTRSCRPGGWC